MSDQKFKRGEKVRWNGEFGTEPCYSLTYVEPVDIKDGGRWAKIINHRGKLEVVPEYELVAIVTEEDFDDA